MPSGKDYHKPDGFISHSMLETLYKSPARYRAQYIDQTIESETTDAMRLGQIIHALVLEPDTFHDEFIICNASRRGTKEHKDVVAAAGEREVVMRHEVDKAQKIVDAVNNNPIAKKYLDDCEHKELEHRWAYRQDGREINCKIRVDAVSFSKGFFIDLKTAANPFPESWDRDAINYGYHRQAAFYFRGLVNYRETITNEAMSHSLYPLFIVVGKTEPHDVLIRLMPDSLVVLGDEQNGLLFDHLRNLEELDDYRRNCQKNICPVEPPQYLLDSFKL